MNRKTGFWCFIPFVLGGLLAGAGSVRAMTVRQNCGGGDVGEWYGDWGYGQGVAVSTRVAIANIGSVPMEVYQTARRDKTVVYEYPDLAPGVYRVILYFAEFRFTEPGQRQFNIVISGKTVYRAFDIVALAGGRYRAFMFAIPVPVLHGHPLQIKLVGLNGALAQINGLEIIPMEGNAIQPNQETLAVRVDAFALGHHALLREDQQPTLGGKGGQVIVQTGVTGLDTGSGRDGVITNNIYLEGGVFEFRSFRPADGAADWPILSVVGSVTIKVQRVFVGVVRGMYDPDNPVPPRVVIHAGEPVVLLPDGFTRFHHWGIFWMTPYPMPDDDEKGPVLYDENGNGLSGGTVVFRTSASGDIFCRAANVSGGDGLCGGAGGDGGRVVLDAGTGQILAHPMIADGGDGGNSARAGQAGGWGGNGGTIRLTASKIRNAMWAVSPFLPWITAIGGRGGDGFDAVDRTDGTRGGRGGHGGIIQITGRLESAARHPVFASGGQGGRGGHGYSWEGLSGSSRHGFNGGNGGNGGYAGQVPAMLLWTWKRPGDGGDGGNGGNGEAGFWDYLEGVYISGGGNGGNGGKGGNSGGKGARPGSGGTAGRGGPGDPPGTDGIPGAHGTIGY